MKAIIVSAMLAASAIGFSSVATAQDDHPGRVHFCGQVIKLEDGRCLAVRDTGGSHALYSINGAMPRPYPGSTISGSGKVVFAPRCGANAALSDVLYRHVDVCPEHR